MTILNFKSAKTAFTLAEVLITLAIIGVVAALTIPNLIQSYKKSVVETRLAKFYNMMNQAIRMSEIDNGSQSTWTDYYENDEFDSDGNVLYEKGEKYDAHVNKYFAPYIKIIGSEEIEYKEGQRKRKVYYLADGTAFGFNLHENRELYFYPFNNPKKCYESKTGCIFTFAFLPTGGMFEYKYNFSNGMQPTLFKWDGNENSLMNDSVRGCKNSGEYCLEIIRRNGWKFPKDISKLYKF